MDPLEQARVAVAIEHKYRQALKESIAVYTTDAGEEAMITTGVVALLVRKLYLARGEDWLEAVLKQVLQPADPEDTSARPS